MLERFTLLYVEDDKAMQEYMKDLLKDEIKEFYQAFDGQEAIELYKQNKPNIILSDINMPKKDGFEMAKEIKRIDPEQIIIFFTALTEIEDFKKAIDLNIDGFINKPLGDIESFFKYIESKIEILEHNLLKKEYEKTKLEKEKLDFIVQTIRQITHHWRQPLNTISMSASIFSFKKTNNMEIKEEDFESAEVIMEQVDKLSSVLKKIELISDEQNTDIQSLTKLMKISDPIYE